MYDTKEVRPRKVNLPASYVAKLKQATEAKFSALP